MSIPSDDGRPTTADGDALWGMGKARVTEDAVRVRDLPDLSSKVLGYLAVGDMVDVWAKQGVWWVVQTVEGLTGWAFSKFMVMVAEVWDGKDNVDAGSAGRGAGCAGGAAGHGTAPGARSEAAEGADA